MAGKLTYSEFKRAVATKAGISQKEASLFVDTMVAQILIALKDDKQVRISGLGTFKKQAIAPRKSVNVATGETIVINGYTKLAFSPESSIKELIENSIRTTHITSSDNGISPLQKLGAQASEIVDILADLGQTPNPDMQENKVSTVDVKKTMVEPLEGGKIETIDNPQPIAASEPPKEAYTKPTEKPIADEIQEPVKEKPVKHFHFWRDVIITTACLLLLVAGGWFFLREQLTNWVEQLKTKIEQQPIEPQKTNNDTNTTFVADTIEIIDSTQTDTTVIGIEPIEGTDTREDDKIWEEPIGAYSAVGNPNKQQSISTDIPAEYNTLEFTKILAIEKMHEDSRLSWMAYRYYGHKELWVFLYEANKDHISNPNKIAVGTPIRIPELTPELKDINNPETIQLIKRLEQALEEKN